MAVVSPALKKMKSSEAERVGVRSTIGEQYARVGTANLILLLVFALFDGLLRGFGAVLYAEYALLAAVFGLVVVHGGSSARGWRGWPRPSAAPRAQKKPGPS
jgi:hypothetical protein